MLSQVAGPIPIVPWMVNGAPAQVLEPVEGFGVWVDGLGLLVRAGGASSMLDSVYIVNLDGKAYLCSTRYMGFNYIVGLGQDDVYDDLWMSVSVWANTARIGVPPFNVKEWRGACGPNSYGQLSDRRIYASGGYVTAATFDGTNWHGNISEYRVIGASDLFMTHSAKGTVPSLNDHSLWWLFERATAKLYLYDATTKAEVTARRTSLGTRFVTGGYSRRHDLFVVVRNDGGTFNLYVYANEPVATSLAAPSFAFVPRRGCPVQVMSRVLGDLGEPCAGRVVSFSATHGYIAPSSVVTDADGYARSTYQPPFTAPGGNETLTATMTE